LYYAFVFPARFSCQDPVYFIEDEGGNKAIHLTRTGQFQDTVWRPFFPEGKSGKDYIGVNDNTDINYPWGGLLTLFSFSVNQAFDPGLIQIA